LARARRLVQEELADDIIAAQTLRLYENAV